MRIIERPIWQVSAHLLIVEWNGRWKSRPASISLPCIVLPKHPPSLNKHSHKCFASKNRTPSIFTDYPNNQKCNKKNGQSQLNTSSHLLINNKWTTAVTCKRINKERDCALNALSSSVRVISAELRISDFKVQELLTHINILTIKWATFTIKHKWDEEWEFNNWVHKKTINKQEWLVQWCKWRNHLFTLFQMNNLSIEPHRLKWPFISFSWESVWD